MKFSSNISDFTEKIKVLSEKAIDAIEEDRKAVTNALFSQVLNNHSRAHKTGLSGFNYFVGIGTEPNKFQMRRSDNTYAGVKSRNRRAVNSSKFRKKDSRVFLANKTPYILKIETHGWYGRDGSGRPPYAPVGKALGFIANAVNSGGANSVKGIQ